MRNTCILSLLIHAMVVIRSGVFEMYRVKYSMDDGTSTLSMTELVEGSKVVTWIVYEKNDFVRPTA